MSTLAGADGHEISGAFNPHPNISVRLLDFDHSTVCIELLLQLPDFVERPFGHQGKPLTTEREHLGSKRRQRSIHAPELLHRLL
ncbi:MAG: hypothetical protein AUK47_06690 [Deltaproteobacteria bacterium CG2_30_63_29]|nr:MAG: hypothetical protein AUK47_06690 [Deltaproteobacteria bacterium CG2_30_63_29]PIV99055.1 MAG: hypothetical protein COW42_12280 [Deltaproteobacteria bacterium CG17_big_fil_post_rev_8_21_14_2_50_63_7]PJB45061.1 MAG: hypothetical protein CO108_07905 [Deltaproteobacteria bacterium CG_4_9_14_3_um_filter_63_12]